jgi:SsrA-binding protein
MARNADQSKGNRVVATNRRAHFDYVLGERFEAGLVLIGSEARSLRENGAGLGEAWVDLASGREAWVKGMRIPVLAHAAFGHEERRARKLLLHAREIEELRAAVERQGMTVVVTRCYFKNKLAKVEIAVARGKKKYDKRQAEREREARRDAEQAIRRGKDA